MKRLHIISLFLICTLTIMAQGISINSFRLLEKDNTANTVGLIEKDQNGEVAALIKVTTPLVGFYFDVGSLGVVNTIQKSNEIWVYVPRGIKKISVSHPQYGMIRDYYLPIPVTSGKTYELVLEANTKKGNESQNNTYQYVIFHVTPSNAIIEFDDEQLQTDGDTAIKMVKLGSYNYRVQAPDYLPEAGNVIVDNADNKHIVHVSLKPDFTKIHKGIVSVDDVSFAMIRVDGGMFRMGESILVDKDADNDERPKHNVSLSTFYIGETEVTQALWEAVMESNPSKFKGKNKPVEQVSWEDCLNFIEKLNKKTGLNFRLPTESEWEFAARGGNMNHGFSYSGSNTIDDVAWYAENSNHMSHDVKTKLPNELGVYDMSGNVYEWCQDFYAGYNEHDQINPIGPDSGSKRVFRGGSWDSYSKDGRVSYRGYGDPNNIRFNVLGFRLAIQ